MVYSDHLEVTKFNEPLVRSPDDQEVLQNNLQHPNRLMFMSRNNVGDVFISEV